MTDHEAPRQNMRCTLTPMVYGVSAEEVMRAAHEVFHVPSRWYMRAPLTPPVSPPRPIAAIEAEIARATVPALRSEDV